MELNDENYYSQEANREYLSASQFKQFVGTYGMRGCEFAAMEELAGRWENETTDAMLIGSYVDSYFESPESFERFKEEHSSVLFTRNGDLYAKYKHADYIIERVKQDELFMKYLSGEKQTIMTGEIAGAKFKVKMDSYIPDMAIVDLKTVKSLTEFKWAADVGRLNFVEYWGYDIQGAIYQEIVRQNTGKKLPFYIAAVSKEKEPDIQIINVTDDYLDAALRGVETAVPRILRIKNGEEEPDRCEVCDCCRKTRKLKRVISLDELQGMAQI